MSEDNKNSEPFDFDFEALNQENPAEKSGEPFDLENPFGDDIVVSRGEVSADNPYLDNALYDSNADALPEESEFPAEFSPDVEKGETTAKKKSFFWGKGKAKKEKVVKEKEAKEDKPPKERVPYDLGSVLCVAFSLFLLASLLVFNIAAFFSRGNSLMQTLCFLGAFNLIGLVAVAVPILFYKFPKERILPNVLLGIAVVAMFASVQICVVEFYRYSFIMSP